MACLSFHGYDGATSGAGGALLTRDPAFAAAARTRSLSRTGHDHTLPDSAAATLRIRLARTDELLQRRSAVAARYADRLTDDDLLSPPHVPQNRTHAWQSYLVTLDPSVDRAAVAADLRAQGIGCGHGSWATHPRPGYERTKHACPVAADLSRRNLAIPMHTELTLSQVERVADALRTALRTHRRADFPTAKNNSADITCGGTR